ncbi:cell wall integrity transcriptional regulator CAS5-like [Chelonus insularis]|uniref:cell wall integrity transcriptional regulator CAS5-like n=1 Tax=Chelonus insularis TaxID=460826 RepID=UPI00158B1191|nr:cell wall integrity transcriptional regulator CAS5-like [Chelonus insularis]
MRFNKVRSDNMSEMTSVEQQQQQQYGGGGSNPEHHCKDCGLYFESGKSLEVHLRYHQENLLSQWASQAQQEESNNNNSKAGNHNSHVGQKRESVTAPADSSESLSQTPSLSPSTSQQQQQQQQQQSQQQQPAQPPVSSQQQPPPGAQGYNHFQTPMFSETSYFMHNEQAYLLPHHYSPTHDDTTNNGGSNYAARYHPYQHQQHFSNERANSVSSTSPRSPLQCDKCGGVFDDANQLSEHVRANHPTSPNTYPAQYQQLGGSPQHSQQQQQPPQPPHQVHTSPPHNNPPSQPPSQQQNFDYNTTGAIIKQETKQEQEEQAEILDLDSHKVQTHRYEDEIVRIHQHHQDMHMQLHQQQQQAIQQQRNASHSVSSMLGWPPAQPHDYHPGMSPMGPMGNVSPIPEQTPFMRGQHIPVESPRHSGSPIITSTQPIPGHPMPTSILQQPTKPPLISNQSWKSNEARRPKTYNCTACNKWFTSSGHLKRHYNTTLHKNAVKQSNQPDPANMPISAHHHPGRDANNITHSTRGGGTAGGTGSASRSPELSSSGSPPNLMAGPSGEAARGLLNTPTNLYTTNNHHSNSNSSDSSVTVCLQHQQQHPASQQPVPTTVHMGQSMVNINSPVQSPMGGHHHHQQGSPSSQLAQHHLSMGSPSPISVHHPMTSPMSPMHPPPPHQHLSSPSQMASHHMNSPSPMMPGMPPMASPPMGGTSMPHQPYPNALPPHVTTTTSLGLLGSITNQLTIIGEHKSEHHQQTQEMLPGFGTFSNHQRSLPSFAQFGITEFLVGHNQPQAVNVGGLSPEEGIPQDRNYNVDESYTSFSPSSRYESLANINSQELHHTETTNGIIKQYEIIQRHSFLRDNRQPETNNNLPHHQGKEEINPNVGKNDNNDGTGKKSPLTTKEHQVTSTGSHYISQDGFHKCIKCNKVFNKACYLTQHNKSFHSGDKPFKCNQCGKRFPLEYLHAEHLQKHAGDKPYKCEICPKQFNHKTDLRRHMCLHTGEKPYACDTCGKGFIRKDHMMKHLDTHKKKSNNQNLHLRA